MYSNSTTHYNLPQYEANDVPSILGDLNGAYNTIDSAIYAAADEASEATATAALAKTTADTAIANVASAQGDATQALADAATADGKAVAAQNDATQALGDASDAMTAAINAQTDATNALTAATNAQTTASSALSAASDATTAAGNAATAASTAQNTANTAVANAATADGKAVAAQSDATQALANAATADGKAVTAQNKANKNNGNICAKSESGATDTEAHNVGSYFYDADGTLVKTTTAIAIGDTIAIGTNCEAVSVTDELGQTVAEYVEVIGDGTKTYSQIYDELFGAITVSKVTPNSKLIVEGGAVLSLAYMTGMALTYGRLSGNASGFEMTTVSLQSSGSSVYTHTRANDTDVSSSVVTSGRSIKLYY